MHCKFNNFHTKIINSSLFYKQDTIFPLKVYPANARFQYAKALFEIYIVLRKTADAVACTIEDNSPILTLF